ncbi:hypothetical protein [Legionella feeleii]|uniref:Transmembrane protein n=1 Tax=Legionella feeleii TaxID=453 RepID=A0A378ITH0_9GAMM|nr:hypothetical protein [Legionella feeleii]STX38353.1 Uncharacterised protein [Legionella feeleii]
MNNKLVKALFYVYGLAWLVGGLLYTSAHMMSPISFSHSIIYTPEIASHFMQKLQPYWGYYAWSFIIFTIADMAVMLLGLAFRYIFGTNFYTNVAVFCFFAAGFTGVMVDLNLLACWFLMGTFKLPPEILQNFWSTFLVIQSHSAILIAWGFLIGSLGVYLVYKASRQSKIIVNSHWTKWTLVIFWLNILAVIALIYGLITTDSIPIAVILMIFMIFAAPIWSFLMIRTLKN